MIISGQRYPDQSNYELTWNSTTVETPYLSAYHKMITEACQDHNMPTLDMDPLEWAQRKNLYVFNLSPIYSSGLESGATTVNYKGSLRINLSFSQQAAEPLTLIICSEYDGLVQITSDRRILTNW